MATTYYPDFSHYLGIFLKQNFQNQFLREVLTGAINQSVRKVFSGISGVF
jgi:hypothetical protein